MNNTNTTIKRLFMVVAFFILLFGGLAIYTTYEYRAARDEVNITKVKMDSLKTKIVELEQQLQACQ